MADKFEELKYFTEVIEQQSITKAADALDVAPSAVSRRLKDLEHRLGAQLIQRTTRQMHLTEVGEKFLQSARQILNDIDEAEQLASADAALLRGKLRLSVPLTFGVQVLMPILAKFMKQHEELTLDLDLNDRKVDMVEEGFDAVIRIAVLDDSSFHARKLGDARGVVIASPEFVQQHGGIKTMDDMRGLPRVVYANQTINSSVIQAVENGEMKSVRLTERLRTNNGTAQVEAAANGICLALLPHFIAKSALDRGSVVEVLPHIDWGSSPINIVYPSNRHMNLRLRSLIDFLVKEFSEQSF